jgi:hypothetical protein
MKVNYSLLMISLFVLNSFTVFSQNDGIKYKLSRITLSTGVVIKARNITLKEGKVSFPSNKTSTGQIVTVSYELSNIKNIEVATKNNFLPGILIGTGVGVIAMLIVENITEKPKTETISGPGYWQTTTTTYTMGPGVKLAIIAGGSGLGTLIGVSIKKGWKTVFPQSTSMFNKFDFNLSLNSKYGNTSGLTLSYKF